MPASLRDTLSDRAGNDFDIRIGMIPDDFRSTHVTPLTVAAARVNAVAENSV